MITVRTDPPAARAAAALFFLSLSIAGSACNRGRTDDAAELLPEAEAAPPALVSAHEAYLRGDWVEMNERLEEVIVDPRSGELALDNAFALLERAYEATNGKLPAHAVLPPDVTSMTLGVMNGANPWGAHRLVFLKLRVTEGRAAHVKDVRVTRLPGEPILALAAGRGELRVTRETKGLEDVSVDLRRVDVLPDRGAFAIQVDFDDAPAIDAIVLASKLVASTQPQITSPGVGQVLRDAPEITWRPYRSPELAPWETRALFLGLSGETTKEAWSFYQWEPGDRGRVRVGVEGTPIARLAPDTYWVDLLYLEERTFGAIRISRAAEAGSRFTVVR